MLKQAVLAGAAACVITASLGVHAAEAPVKSAGGVLVGSTGMTLYTFDKDTAGSGKSVCNGQCATAWPPLLAQPGAQPSGPYTLVTRDDGKQQWAFQGKPLYYYQADQKAGDRNGDNFREIWHVVRE